MGFNGYVATDDAFFDLFDRQRADKIQPPEAGGYAAPVVPQSDMDRLRFGSVAAKSTIPDERN